MQRLINWFKHLDNTKKVVIVFVSVSFALILSVTIFNIVSGNNVDQKIDVSQKQAKKKTDNKNEKNETTKEEAVVEDEKATEETSNENVTSNVETQTNSNSEVNKSDPSNTENTPAVQNINISVSIVGMNDEVIAFENIVIEQGTTAYDCLKQFTSIRGIAMESSGFAYVTNIAGLKEKQHGSSSGWMYKVNEVTPFQSSGKLVLNDNDQMEWYYVYN